MLHDTNLLFLLIQHLANLRDKLHYLIYQHVHLEQTINEPVREKTNNLRSDQVRHKPACTVTEVGYKLEILDLRRRGIVQSM